MSTLSTYPCSEFGKINIWKTLSMMIVPRREILNSMFCVSSFYVIILMSSENVWSFWNKRKNKSVHHLSKRIFVSLCVLPGNHCEFCKAILSVYPVARILRGLKHLNLGPEGKRGTLPPPPWPTKIVCFSTFFEENSIFFGTFQANWKILPSPGKKSLRTPMGPPSQ